MKAVLAEMLIPVKIAEVSTDEKVRQIFFKFSAQVTGLTESKA